MLSLHKPVVERLIRRYVVPLFLTVPPTVITLLGIIPALLFFIFLSQRWYAAALISLLGLFIDSVDGAVARYTGKVTVFGGFLDSVLDRVADALLAAGFGVSGLVSWSVVTLMIVGAFLISYMRARANNILLPGIMERTERVIGFGICVIVGMWREDLVGTIFGIVLIFIFITIVQRAIGAFRILTR